MARFYFYKLTTDNGGAPCVQDDLLSLAICKPMLRSTAEVGDFVLGFAANSLNVDNRLIYVARVTEKLRDGQYWSGDRFEGREDCIYEHRDGTFVLRRNPAHHQDVGHREHDLGPAPFYSRANVLLSSDFRYFGGNGTDDYKSLFPQVKEAIEHLGQGHRVWHSPEIMTELEALKEWVWSTTHEKVLGASTIASGPCECDDEDCVPASQPEADTNH